LLEHRATCRDAARNGGIEDIGVADVAGEERAGFGGDRLGDRERLPVHCLELMLAADDAQFLAMRIIGEGFDDVGSRVDEIAVDLRDDLGMIEHRFRHESARLHVTAALELEQVTFGAAARTVGEAFDEPLALLYRAASGFDRAFGRPGGAHTHGQWLLLAPKVLPFAKRSSANGANSATAAPLARCFATSLPAPVILKP